MRLLIGTSARLVCTTVTRRYGAVILPTTHSETSPTSAARLLHIRETMTHTWTASQPRMTARPGSFALPHPLELVTTSGEAAVPLPTPSAATNLQTRLVMSSGDGGRTPISGDDSSHSSRPQFGDGLVSGLQLTW